MFRILTRSVVRFFAAIMLLALALCAVEVCLRTFQLRAEMQRGWPSGAQDLTIPNPISWIDVRPLLDMQHSVPEGGSVLVRTNEFGLRAKSVAIPKPRGRYRILCLGGDCVFGSDLEAEKSFPGRLQRYLESASAIPVEVINAGCPGSGPLVNLLRFRSHLCALQPDLVILCVNPEDAAKDAELRGALHLDLERNPAFAAHPGLASGKCQVLDGLCREFVTARWLLGSLSDAAGLKPNQSTTAQGAHPLGRRELAPLVPLAELVESHFGNLVVSIAPSAWSIEDARIPGGLSTAVADDVKRFCMEQKLNEKVGIQDSLSAFCQLSDVGKYFSPHSGNLSAAGNDRYARQVAQFLLETVSGLAAAPSPSSPGTSLAPIPWTDENPPLMESAVPPPQF
jgi:hypothetical protein